MKLNIVSPINSLGYGTAGSNIAASLSRDHEVSLFPVGRYEPPGNLAGVLDTCRSRSAFYDEKAPSLRIFHQNALAEHVGRGPRIGFPFFELDRLTATELHHTGRMDVLLVASEWARRVVIDSGISLHKTRVVPLGVDRTIFHEGVRGDGLYGDQTVFFTVGKFEKRKGHDFILRCFNRAFEPTDKVVLRLMCENPLIGEGNRVWADSFDSSKMGAAGRIDLVPRVRTQAEVARFMASGDVGLFPSRAEGWNLDLLEAMSVGKAVIATDYSAHTAYCDSMNCSLISVDGLEDAHDGVWFRGEGKWARLGGDQEEQMVHHMRAMHRVKQCGAPTANALGVETAKKFSWDASAAALAAIF